MNYTIPDDVARAVFDIAVHSMDFSSGFLSSEEVTQLRAYAEIIGVDPMEATPHEHKPKYCPSHEYESYKGY